MTIVERIKIISTSPSRKAEKILFCFYFGLSVFLRNFYGLTKVRYVLLVAWVLCAAFFSLQSVSRWKLKGTLVSFCCLVFGLAVISLVRQLLHQSFNLLFLRESLYLLVPVVTVFFAVNADPDGSCSFYVSAFFWFTILDFLLRFAPSLTIGGLRSVSFRSSYSPYECELADCFTACLFYYLFVELKKGRAFVSFVGNWLCMKRTHVFVSFLFVVLFLALLILRKKRTAVFSAKWKIPFTALYFVGMCMVPVFLVGLSLSPSFQNQLARLLGTSVNGFTSGRTNFYALVLGEGDIFYGFGTLRPYLMNLNYPGFYDEIHSDLLKVYIETGAAGVALFSLVYARLFGKNFASGVFMSYIFLTMAISHIYSTIENMVLIFFVLAAIYQKSGQEGFVCEEEAKLRVLLPFLATYRFENENIVC